ncbi:hypothetical protein OKA04_04695 [Luteolibacter flavescens]|uniref:Uncharacterized protein n=1 Tax=Luteolibacter flavescens TaxID=1859460 RepID=A0ABT3FKE3_9BACT|nr:hypothetical protein [Luteolibacter flavescens]MCW1884015.1 hypothetical protein [Luteolibacter flavescens]
MIKVTAVAGDKGAKAFLVDIGDKVVNRTELNQALATRYVEVVQGHWRAKNRKGNKLKGPRTNFWSKAAQETGITSVTEEGATVTVGGEAGQNVRIHIFGGTIKPKVAKAITIPLVPEAHGLRAAEYEQKHGDLFSIPNVPLLFEQEGGGRGGRKGTQSLLSNTTGRTNKPGPGNTIPLAARTAIRPVYYLADEVTIPRDATALPDEATIIRALQEEAEDWIDALGGGS